MHHALGTTEESLLAAQQQAVALFDTLEAEGFVHAGQSERELNDRVYRLAEERFGVRKHWHKRIVRSGPNTIHPYRENPPDRVIEADDILFFDFGPLFDEWEADFGRTYVLGDDPIKHHLQADLLPIFQQGKAFYQANPAITGAELYQYICDLSEQAGWHYGGPHAGHLIGRFPHEGRLGETPENYICPENTTPMNQPAPSGEARHWILEIHLVNAERTFGGFYEDLLSLNRP